MNQSSIFSQDPVTIARAKAAAAAVAPPIKPSQSRLAADDAEYLCAIADQYPTYNGRQVAVYAQQCALGGKRRDEAYLRAAARIVALHRGGSSKKSKSAQSASRKHSSATTSTVPIASRPVPHGAAASHAAASHASATPAAITVSSSTMFESAMPVTRTMTDEALSPLVRGEFAGKVFFGPPPLKAFYQAVSRTESFDRLRALAAVALRDPPSIEYKEKSLHPDDAAMFDAVVASITS